MNESMKSPPVNKKRRAILPRLIFAAFVIALTCITSVTVLKVLYPVKYPDIVAKYSQSYGVDESLIYAVICTESSFDTEAKSNVGALGLMQIMPDTLDWICTKSGEKLDFDDLLDAEISIRCGTYMLRMLLDEFDNPKAALAAYHAGRGCVNGWLADDSLSPDGKTLEKIPYRDTAHYVSKVMRARDIYLNLYKLTERNVLD